MPLTAMDFRNRGRRLVCTSGDTRFFVVPGNRIAMAQWLEVDTRNQSGLTATIGIQVRDSYAPDDTTTSGTTIRKEISLKAGDVISINFDGEFQLFGGVDIRTDFSGPIVSFAAAFR